MKAGRKRLADSILLDYETGTITIDGIELPWWVEADPEVAYDNPTSILRIGILCEGVVTIQHAGANGAVSVYDSRLGDVGEWARSHVRAELFGRIAWLKE